jgi:hypothetical protein
MAGKHHGPEVDPALVKWNQMMVNRHKYFRWTPRTVGITFMFMVVVPGIMGTAGYMTEGKWDMRGKRRGDLISEF